jgi:hypothetical protein
MLSKSHSTSCSKRVHHGLPSMKKKEITEITVTAKNIFGHGCQGCEILHFSCLGITGTCSINDYVPERFIICVFCKFPLHLCLGLKKRNVDDVQLYGQIFRDKKLPTLQISNRVFLSKYSKFGMNLLQLAKITYSISLSDKFVPPVLSIT